MTGTVTVCAVLSPLLALLGAGPVIAVVVQLLKRVVWVQRHPRVVAAVLAGLASALAGVMVCGADLGQVLAAWVAALAGATAAYEYGVKPAMRSGGRRARGD